jgi:high-affinity Fe2+/Pb2+ permease
MKQTKKQSIIESITQTVIGLVTSFLIQLVIYPILNIPVTFSQNLIITFVFFLASILRGYLIRRFFNNKLK